MAPVDARTLTLAMRRHDKQGAYFQTARAKTDREVIATLSTEMALLDRYLAGLPFTVPADQPFIRNRSGRCYSKDTLGDDFRDVRAVVFPGDARRLMDMRRTGNVEAVVGGAEPAQLSAKLANTLSQSNQIFETYSPVQLATVREADKARAEGRRRLRKAHLADAIRTEQENESGNFPTGAPAIESELSCGAPLSKGKKKQSRQ